MRNSKLKVSSTWSLILTSLSLFAFKGDTLNGAMHEHICTEIHGTRLNENIRNCNALLNHQQKASSLLNCEIQFRSLEDDTTESTE